MTGASRAPRVRAQPAARWGAPPSRAPQPVVPRAAKALLQGSEVVTSACHPALPLAYPGRRPGTSRPFGTDAGLQRQLCPAVPLSRLPCPDGSPCRTLPPRPCALPPSAGVDYYRVDLEVPEEAYELNFVFSNGDGLFDNNFSQVGGRSYRGTPQPMPSNPCNTCPAWPLHASFAAAGCAMCSAALTAAPPHLCRTT